MTVKAKLKVVLLANDLVVAESEDPVFWRRVLSALSAPHPDSTMGATAGFAVSEDDVGQQRASDKKPPPMGEPKSDVEAFAAELGIDVAVLQGACSPGHSPPYIYLDTHCFEAFKKNTAPRGPLAVPNVTLAATLLVLWHKHAKLEAAVGVSEVHAVLGTLHLQGPNPARSLNNCRWLQYRSGRISLHPAEISRAVAVARAFCTKTSIGGE